MGKKPGVNVTHRDDGWAVIRDNAQRAARIFDTQQDAINYGRPIARRDRTELRIQGEDSRWRDSDSYGRDPHPPKDTKH
jgi:hypothetical protein